MRHMNLTDACFVLFITSALAYFCMTFWPEVLTRPLKKSTLQGDGPFNAHGARLVIRPKPGFALQKGEVMRGHDAEILLNGTPLAGVREVRFRVDNSGVLISELHLCAEFASMTDSAIEYIKPSEKKMPA